MDVDGIAVGHASMQFAVITSQTDPTDLKSGRCSTMKKLYRSTLIAGVLAFGVAACGDDVQIVDPEPTPPPALQVTLTPSNVNLNVGDNVNLAVGISGGDPAASPSITCESSNTDVVTASASGSNCAVEAVGSGNATVTATVTKGNQESSAGAAISVTDVADLTPASVSIESIRQHPGGGTVDLDDASGQLDVTMNVRFNDEQPVRLLLYVDDEVVATQEYATAVAALEEGEDPEEVVEQVTLSFRSDYYEIEDGEAWIRTLNGEREISARLEVATADAEPRASNTVTVNFNNADGFHVNAMLPEGSAMDGEGRRWYGGWGEDEGAEITAIPVFFSGESAANVRVTLGSDESGLCPEGAQVGTEAPFQFSFSCANFESERTDDVFPAGANHTGEVPSITAQYADSGNDVPEVDGSVRILNDDHPFPVRIDNVAPGLNPGEYANTAAIDGVLFIGTQEGLWNRENWINDEYDFSTGLLAAYVDYDDGDQVQVSCSVPPFGGERYESLPNGGSCDLRFDDEIRDGGSSFEADIDVQFYVSAPGEGLEDAEPVDSPADAAESNTNREYQLHVVLTDALGNERVITQIVNPYAAAEEIDREEMPTAFMVWSHGLNTFGVDRTAPVIEVDNEAALEFGEDYIVQSFADNGSPAVDQYLIYFEAFDEVSGFAHPGAFSKYGEFSAMLAEPTAEVQGFDAAVAHVFGKITGDAQTNEPQSQWYFETGDQDSFVDTPFATSAAGEFIATPVPFTEYNPDDTKLVFDVDLAGAELGMDPDDAGYYIYQMRAQDKAGNRTEISSIRSYVNAGVNPDASGFNAGGNLIGGQSVTFPGTAEDDVEIFNASFAFYYPGYERPEAAAAELGYLVYDRNPEQLTDLFDDEILRRADFQHETTFIRSLRVWPDVDGDASQPTAIQTRAYSGYTFSGDAFIHLNADDQEASHLSEFVAGNGFSAYGGASILSTQLQDPGDFADAELENWTIAEDNGDLVATARGISGQFSNPFHTVVFVARFDVDGDEYLVPMGAVARGDATQLDSGIYRDYFFTFDLSEFDLPAGVEESDLLGYHAVGLNDGWDGLATGLAEFEQPEDPAEYSVSWDPAENDDESPIELDLGESQTFDVTVLLDTDPAEGEEVTVTSSGLQGTFNYSSPVSFSTDASGVGSFTFTASSTSESSGTITATVAGESVTWYVSVEGAAFSLTISGPATLTVPENDPETWGYDVESSTGDLDDVTCALEDAPAGVSVAADDANGEWTCQITVEPTAGTGTFSVEATGTSNGDVASAQQDVTLEEDPDEPPATFSTTFSEYVQGGFPNDWTDRGIVLDAGATVEVAEDGEGTPVLRIDMPDNDPSIHRNASWDAPGTPTDVRIEATIVPGSGFVPVYVTARGAADDNYYRLQIRDGDLLEIAGFFEGSLDLPIGGEGGPGDATFVYSATDTVNLLFEAQGDQLRGKAWTASQSEPASWMVEVTDGTIESAGWTGVGRLHEGVLDVLSFSVTPLD
jgi:hypothetical protein